MWYTTITTYWCSDSEPCINKTSSKNVSFGCDTLSFWQRIFPTLSKCMAFITLICITMKTKMFISLCIPIRNICKYTNHTVLTTWIQHGGKEKESQINCNVSLSKGLHCSLSLIDLSLIKIVIIYCTLMTSLGKSSTLLMIWLPLKMS